MTTNETILFVHRAIRNGAAEDVYSLLENDEELLHIWTPFGTWLQDAASLGNLLVAKWLVQKGLDVNAYNEQNPTPPLANAAARGHVDIVRFLIESGASLDVSDSVRNPLLSAIVGDLSESHTAVAKLLIDAGLDTTVRYLNLSNMNALDFAKEWGRTDIVELLKSSSK